MRTDLGMHHSWAWLNPRHGGPTKKESPLYLASVAGPCAAWQVRNGVARLWPPDGG